MAGLRIPTLLPLAVLVLALIPGTALAAEVTIACAPACSVVQGTEVEFTATSTGPVLDYAWNLDEDGVYGARDGEPEGPSATRARRAFPTGGRFFVAVRVRDPRGTTSFARQIVTVAEAGPPGPTPNPAVPPPVIGAVLPVPPAVDADDDGDGLPAARDACPDSPPGLRARVGGCSVLDALTAPRAVIGMLGGPDTKGLGGPDTFQRLGLRGLPGGKAPLRRLDGAIAELRRAALALPSRPCGSSADAGDALRALRRGLGGIDGALARRTRKIGRAWGRKVGGGDSGVGDGQLAGVLLKRKHAHDLAGDATRLRALLTAACAADNGRAKVRGRVKSIAGTLVTLTGGRRVAFGGAEHVGGLAPGTLVAASGRRLDGGLIVASGLSAVGVKGKAALEQCEFALQIAPVQDFSVGLAKIVFDDARAFFWSGFYRLEHGMRLGAARSGCTAKDDYALRVSASWGPKSNPQSRYLGVLRGTLGFEAPLLVPDDLPSAVRLKVALYGLDCDYPKDIQVCDSGQLIYERTNTASVRPDGYWADATYDRNEFEVADGSATDFDVALLKGLVAPKLPGASVFGVGYAAQGGASAYPQRSFILKGQSFAVHDDVPTQADPRGLFHAYANGFHDGHAYHYVAKLPAITTDKVPGCGYYRLPWKANTIQTTTQGNNGDVTHSGGQKYAFDFRMPLFTPGRATRGGLVTLVIENRTKTSNPLNVKAGLEPWLPGNLLLIRHQDGTTSFYTHMHKNGVLPAEDEYVERGDPIIVVGNTGNSTGAHLHYHVTSTGDTEDDSYGGSVPIQFEALGAGFQPTCLVPQKGKAYVSTNG
jgi:peptidase M23-like protein